jgi:hypothetical protein
MYAIYDIALEGPPGRFFTERVDSDQLPYDLQIFLRLLAGDSVNNQITKHLRVDGQPVILAYPAPDPGAIRMERQSAPTAQP